jgi:ubiquitin C-terminal hydrolase
MELSIIVEIYMEVIISQSQKNPINKKWYEFNDSRVKHIDSDKVEERIISSQSYILFYQKQLKSELD